MAVLLLFWWTKISHTLFLLLSTTWVPKILPLFKKKTTFPRLASLDLCTFKLFPVVSPVVMFWPSRLKTVVSVYPLRAFFLLGMILSVLCHFWTLLPLLLPSFLHLTLGSRRGLRAGSAGSRFAFSFLCVICDLWHSLSPSYTAVSGCRWFHWLTLWISIEVLEDTSREILI